MPRKKTTNPDDKRENFLTVRFSKTERDFILQFCTQNGLKPGSFLREASIDYAGRLLEHDEIMKNLDPDEQRVFRDVLHNVFDGFKKDLLKTYDSLDKRIVHLETMLETFVYLYLILTKDVAEEEQGEAIEQAQKRLETFKRMVKRRYGTQS